MEGDKLKLLSRIVITFVEYIMKIQMFREKYILLQSLYAFITILCLLFIREISMMIIF